MSMTIGLATKILRAEAEKYKREFDRLTQEKQIALENAKKNFIGEALKAEIEKIEQNFTIEIVDAKAEAMKAAECLSELRAQELKEVQSIDKNTVEKINALKDLPLGEDEFVALMGDDAISGNYWAKKALMAVAERNNIDVVSVGIGADYSVKLSVLSQLENQLTEIVEKYPCNDDKTARARVAYANLSENVCDNACAIYDGTSDVRTETAKADKSIMFIKAQQGNFDRAMAISNAFRNSKTAENRERMLYALAMDKEIPELCLQMGGVYDDVVAFREGKAAQYEKACRAMENVRKTTLKEDVDLIKSEYSDNDFFARMYDDELKKSETLRSLTAPLVDNVPGEVAEADGKKIDAE